MTIMTTTVLTMMTMMTMTKIKRLVEAKRAKEEGMASRDPGHSRSRLLRVLSIFEKGPHSSLGTSAFFLRPKNMRHPLKFEASLRIAPASTPIFVLARDLPEQKANPS